MLSAVDAFAAGNPLGRFGGADQVVAGVKVGLLALNAGALDSRIRAVCVSGYSTTGTMWESRSAGMYLDFWTQFGDAGSPDLIAPLARRWWRPPGAEITQ